jgi:hypothetical protein
MVAHVQINVQIAPTIECSAFRNYVWFFWGIQMEVTFVCNYGHGKKPVLKK